ncbi:transposase [Paracraurococcus ruber]|nr:transposase [Paracraurococcus ruber]
MPTTLSPSPSPLPPDLIPRLLTLYRQQVDPGALLTPVRPWAPLSDAEWAALAPLLARASAAGRPTADPRGRLDAIFRAVTLKHPRGGRACWHQLPEAFGRHDTIARCYRRWAHAGLWARLLLAVARPDAPPALRGLAYRACCAFRRGHRLMGLWGVLLARRLGLHSALPAPAARLFDPDLSESLHRAVPGVLGWVARDLRRRIRRGPLQALLRLMDLAGGRRACRALEPA